MSQPALAARLPGPGEEALGQSPELPELAAVPWRERVSAASLRRRGRLWTLTTLAHSIPFLFAAAFLAAISPVTAPVALILLAHAVVIPELYAARGANVLLPQRRGKRVVDEGAERVAAGLLGDLVSHAPRELFAASGLITEPGELGVWVVGEAGAVLVAPGARRIFCLCVKATDPELPAGDRVAHLLLALREDEIGFATVANLAFSGSPRRLRRRLRPRARPALDAARQAARLIEA